MLVAVILEDRGDIPALMQNAQHVDPVRMLDIEGEIGKALDSKTAQTAALEYLGVAR